MAAETGKHTGSQQFMHLSNPDPAWLQVATKHQTLEDLADELYRLPITEFRKVAYRPPPLPSNAPVIGRNITVDQDEFTARDGTRIGVRVYRPIEHGSNHLLFFNIHGGGRTNFQANSVTSCNTTDGHAGWTVGTPETEEAQNRQVAAKNKTVVVSVDYRR
jgi:acetyl esterase/lipase